MASIEGVARKLDAERWLKVSEADAPTGQWVDPSAGADFFGLYVEEWIMEPVLGNRPRDSERRHTRGCRGMTPSITTSRSSCRVPGRGAHS